MSSAAAGLLLRRRAWREDLGSGAGLLLLTPLTLVLVFAFLFPLGWLAWLSFTDPQPGIGAYEDVLSRRAGRRSFENTLTTSAIVTAVSVLAGGFLAWELRNARSALYRGLLWATLLFPLWTSVIVRNYAMTLILQRKGVVNDFLVGLGLVSEPVNLLYTNGAVVAGMAHALIPYAALPLYAAFVLIDDDVEQAARSLGASSARAFTSIVLPLALPSVVAAGTLVFVVATGFYVAPVVLGGPSNLFVATFIDQQINELFDLPGAAAASVLLLAVGLVVVLVTTLLVGWRHIERALS